MRTFFAVKMGLSDSEEYTTDDGKRRKRTGNLHDFLGKAAKIKKSPGKSEKSEDKLNTIIEMIQELKTEVKSDLRGIRKDQKGFWEELVKVKEENEVLRKENLTMKREIDHLKQRVEMWDREGRRNNIVLQGVPIPTQGEKAIKDSAEEFIREKLEVEVNVRGARKLGEKTYLLELNSNEEKQMVMRNKNKLRKMQDMKVYINSDTSKEDREIQGVIRTVAREERGKGNTVKVKFHKIEINNEEWIWDREGKRLVVKHQKN